MKPCVLKAIATTTLCLISYVPLAGATTYYFSSSQGNDTNSGTSVAVPWKSLTKIYFTPFTAGDSILLKSGDIFDQTITIERAGTQNAPIAIGRYGAGANPIIYGDNPNAAWSAANGHPGVYSAAAAFPSTIVSVYDINANPYTRTNQGSDSLDVWLGKFATNNWGFSFDTPTLVYIRTPDGTPPPQMHLFQYSAVEIGSAANYITVENLDIRRSYSGIVANSAQGLKIINNSIQDTLSMGIYCGIQCFYAEIATNVVTRGGSTMVYFSTGGSNWVHNNYISYCTSTILGIAVNGPERCGIGLERGTYNIVEYNTISNVDMSCFDYWLEVGSDVRYNYGFHTGAAAYPDGTGLKVHNNVFNLDGQGAGIGGTHDYDPLKSPAPDAGANLIYNNVIYNFTGYGFYSGSGSSSGIVFRNNVLVTTSPVQSLLQLNSGMDTDYNLFYCMAGTPNWYWNNVKYTTLASFQAGSGQEAHSLYANPQFISANPTAAAGFQSGTSSPCIDTGQNLKLAGLLAGTYLYQDFVGMPIPQGSGPDIGAYEKIAPPTNLHQTH